MSEFTPEHTPGRALDIEVDWEPRATCSVCEDGGDIVINNVETLICNECDTKWSLKGTDGERNPHRERGRAMSDVNEWLKERRAIHDAAKEDAARVLWEHDDPEGESPNENFEDEPKWERERLKQAAQAVLESSDAHNTFPAP